MKLYDFLITLSILFGVLMLTHAVLELQESQGLSGQISPVLASIALICLLLLLTPFLHLKISIPFISAMLAKQKRIADKRRIMFPSFFLIAPFMFSVVGIFLFFLVLTLSTGNLFLFFIAYPISIIYLFYSAPYYEKQHPGMGVRVKSIWKMLLVGYAVIAVIFMFG